MRDYAITAFKHGVVNAIEAQSIPDGAASSSLNWLTKGDHLEVRRGLDVLGRLLGGVGRVNGVHTARKVDGTEVLFLAFGGNLYYYDDDNDVIVEIGTSLLAGETPTLLASINEASQNSSATLFPISYPVEGQPFQSGDGGTLESCKFYLKKQAGAIGTAYAKLYQTTLDGNGYYIATGDPLATSGVLDVSTLTTSYQLITFTFTGSERYLLAPDTTYGIAIYYATGDNLNGIEVGEVHSVGNSTFGNQFTAYDGVNFVSNENDDVCFYVYVTPFVEGEDVTFDNYNTNAGSQVWLNSPNTSLFKIMTANPGDYANMYDGSYNFKGYITIKQNRMWLWGRTNDKSGVYGSYIDTANYTTVTAEARHSGDASTTTFSGTLSFKSGQPKRTCFGVAITDGTETFTDDYSGVLTGSAGGTGTINYMTGAYSVTFHTAPAVGVNNVTATYQWENSNSNGISDFTKSSPRTAGQGFVFRQDDGGSDMKTIQTIGETEYCFHEFKTWALTLTSTDTNATNTVFRQNVGTPYLRSALATSEGVYYIDVTDKSKPLFRKLYLNGSSPEVLPKTVTENIDLTGYNFDRCAMEEWNDYIIFSGATNDSTVNNRLFLYHKIWKSIDIIDYYASCFAIYNGTLVSGESVSNNIVTLFSGFDDDDSLITNEWIGNISDLGAPGWLKKSKRLIVEGLIAPTQTIEIYLSDDRGGFVLQGTINGSGSYVDAGNAVYVGANTIGSKEIGGGGDGVSAYHYTKEIRVIRDKFENRQIKIVATGIGYASVTKINHHDVQLHRQKLPRKYRSTP